MTNKNNPFTAPLPQEVHLPKAPLERVIAQVRFPEILEIGDRDAVAKFQKTIRSTYPILRTEQIQGIEIGPEGIQPSKPRVAWRFSDAEGKWRVALATNFLALDTSAYKDRADFIARLVAVVKALEEVFDPGQIDRFGVRYVDRLDSGAVGDLHTLVRPEVRGIVGSDVFENVVHTIQESSMNIGDDQMMARWGILPPDTTLDPAVLDPRKDQSWFLDVDMFSTKPAPFSTDAVAENAGRYADNIYRFFRWAVTPDLLTRYGGKI